MAQPGLSGVSAFALLTGDQQTSGRYHREGAHAFLGTRSPLIEGLNFVRTELFAALFNALRLFVAVLSDLSVCSCVLKAFFSERSGHP
jgi:hypothetical protein